MPRLGVWDFLQLIAALASIAGLLLIGTSPTCAIPGIAGGLITVGLGAVIGLGLLARRGPPTKIGRDAMIATGRRLIDGAKKEVVLFGSDMSWAGDYAEIIQTVTSRGKKVKVLYPLSNATKVVENANVLRRAGAELITTPIDSGLRGMLVDADDPTDVLLFIATRTLRKGAPPVKPGEAGNESTYKYIGKIYDIRHDHLLIKATTKVVEVLCRSSN